MHVYLQGAGPAGGKKNDRSANISQFLRIYFFLVTIMELGWFFAFLMCFSLADGGIMINYDPSKTEEKQEKVDLMSNFQLKLKGTEKRNAGTVTKFEVKLKDSREDKKEPNFKLSLKNNENENESPEVFRFHPFRPLPLAAGLGSLSLWSRLHMYM